MMHGAQISLSAPEPSDLLGTKDPELEKSFAMIRGLLDEKYSDGGATLITDPAIESWGVLRQRDPENYLYLLSSAARLHGGELRRLVAEKLQTRPSLNRPPSAERKDWPEALDEAAYHGLAGEIVKAIAPHTEADPSAILIQVLVSFGALTGRTAYVPVEGDRHFPNLFALLVGETSKARKGTSWGRVREPYSKVENWPRVVEGLSSGEGLKWNVRDGDDDDVGIEDKRLLVVESEFAQVLRQTARAGNTLSPTMRAAWDTGNLATLTKNDPITATDAHIAIIGHITAHELRAELTATDTANGFANRFIFMCVRRSKTLPFGGRPLASELVQEFSQRLARAAGKQIGEVGMSAAARKAWAEVYPVLSEPPSGLYGAVTARAEAQVLRLALTYAMVDESPTIEEPHLYAALAVWERAQASVLYVFGSALGDPVADEILRALRAAGLGGLTRTAIRDLFKRNQTTERIGAALELLSGRNLARCETQSTESGRPPEIWRSV